MFNDLATGILDVKFVLSDFLVEAGTKNTVLVNNYIMYTSRHPITCDEMVGDYSSANGRLLANVKPYERKKEREKECE